MSFNPVKSVENIKKQSAQTTILCTTCLMRWICPVCDKQIIGHELITFENNIYNHIRYVHKNKKITKDEIISFQREIVTTFKH